MRLRSEIEPNLGMVETRFPIVYRLIKKYEEALDQRKHEKIPKILQEFKQITHREVNEQDLLEHWEGTGIGVMALKLSLPEPAMVENITKEELAELLRRIKSMEYANEIESQLQSDVLKSNKMVFCAVLADYYYKAFIKLNFAYQNLHQLFQRRKRENGFVKLTQEEMIDRIMNNHGNGQRGNLAT